jgi:hypothetical protein
VAHALRGCFLLALQHRHRQCASHDAVRSTGGALPPWRLCWRNSTYAGITQPLASYTSRRGARVIT